MEGELTSLASRILSAARRGDLLEMEKILALGGLTVDCHDDDGNTAIATACAYGNLSMVHFLVSKGADYELCNNYGWTPLHHAHSHKDVLEFLLEKLKADPVIRNFLGCSTLTLALRNGQKDVVDRLIRCQVDYQDTSIGVADMELTNLMAAVMSGRKDLCEQLISSGADVNASMNFTGLTALMLSAIFGYTELAELLCQRGVDISVTNTVGQTALDLARIHKQVVTESFLRAVSSCQPYDSAISFPSLRSLQRTEDLSIMTAVATKHSDLVSHLLSRNPHLVDVVEPIWGLTPLIIAAGLGCNYVLQSLIDSGAKVDQMDKSGWTPLTMALAHKCEPETILPTSHGYIKYLFSRIEIVRLLLSFNPAVEAKQIWEISSILECNGGAETIKAIGSKRLSVSSKLFSLFKTDNFNIERLKGEISLKSPSLFKACLKRLRSTLKSCGKERTSELNILSFTKKKQKLIADFSSEHRTKISPLGCAIKESHVWGEKTHSIMPFSTNSYAPNCCVPTLLGSCPLHQYLSNPNRELCEHQYRCTFDRLSNNRLSQFAHAPHFSLSFLDDSTLVFPMGISQVERCAVTMGAGKPSVTVGFPPILVDAVTKIHLEGTTAIEVSGSLKRGRKPPPLSGLCADEPQIGCQKSKRKGGLSLSRLSPRPHSYHDDCTNPVLSASSTSLLFRSGKAGGRCNSLQPDSFINSDRSPAATLPLTPTRKATFAFSPSPLTSHLNRTSTLLVSPHIYGVKEDMSENVLSAALHLGSQIIMCQEMDPVKQCSGIEGISVGHFSMGEGDLRHLFRQLSLDRYLPVFEAQEIDADVFLTLTDTDIQDLGIVEIRSRNEILKAIRTRKGE